MTHNPYLSLTMQHNDYTGKHISTVFSPTCIYPYTSCARSSYLISVLQAFGLESVFANKSYKIISIIHPFPSSYWSGPSYSSRGIMTPEPPQSALEHHGAVTQLHTQTSTQLTMNESVIYNQKPTLMISVLTVRSDPSSRNLSALV